MTSTPERNQILSMVTEALKAGRARRVPARRFRCPNGPCSAGKRIGLKA